MAPRDPNDIKRELDGKFAKDSNRRDDVDIDTSEDYDTEAVDTLDELANHYRFLGMKTEEQYAFDIACKMRDQGWTVDEALDHVNGRPAPRGPQADAQFAVTEKLTDLKNSRKPVGNGLRALNDLDTIAEMMRARKGRDEVEHAFKDYAYCVQQGDELGAGKYRRLYSDAKANFRKAFPGVRCPDPDLPGYVYDRNGNYADVAEYIQRNDPHMKGRLNLSPADGSGRSWAEGEEIAGHLRLARRTLDNQNIDIQDRAHAYMDLVHACNVYGSVNGVETSTHHIDSLTAIDSVADDYDKNVIAAVRNFDMWQYARDDYAPFAGMPESVRDHVDWDSVADEMQHGMSTYTSDDGSVINFKMKDIEA